MFVVWTVPSSVLDDPIAVSTASFSGLPRNWDFTPFSDTLGFIYHIPMITLKLSKSAASANFASSPNCLIHCPVSPAVGLHALISRCVCQFRHGANL